MICHCYRYTLMECANPVFRRRGTRREEKKMAMSMLRYKRSKFSKIWDNRDHKTQTRPSLKWYQNNLQATTIFSGRPLNLLTISKHLCAGYPICWMSWNVSLGATPKAAVLRRRSIYRLGFHGFSQILSVIASHRPTSSYVTTGVVRCVPAGGRRLPSMKVWLSFW